MCTELKHVSNITPSCLSFHSKKRGRDCDYLMGLIRLTRSWAPHDSEGDCSESRDTYTWREMAERDTERKPVTCQTEN